MKLNSEKSLVTIVIPNFNGQRFLKTCLDSINQQSFRDFSVIVVDNGSQDQSLRFLQDNYPEVEIIAFESNRGFSTAVNAGIKTAASPYVCLLNNDLELDTDFLAEMIQTLENNPQVDYCAARMLNYYQPQIVDGAGDEVFRAGAGYRNGTLEADSPLFDEPRMVFGACAGAAVYRRSFFEVAGLFDEDFFAYLEDVDINFRAALAGMKCVYVPTAKVYHIGSATSGSTFNHFTVRFTTKNLFNVLVKNYPTINLMRNLYVIILYHLCWLIFAIKKKHFLAYLQGVWGGAERFSQNVAQAQHLASTKKDLNQTVSGKNYSLRKSDIQFDPEAAERQGKIYLAVETLFEIVLWERRLKSVSVIIVNWNGVKVLEECLQSLRHQTYDAFDITVVDNGSTDGSVEFVRRWFPEVRTIALSKNLGFGIANNIVAKDVASEYTALLNNDTVPEPLWLQKLVEALDAVPDAGFAASKMVFYDKRNIIDRMGDGYTRAGAGRLRGRGEQATESDERQWVFGACAGAALYRTAMLAEIGFFDEDFFLLYEDVDLSFRAQLQGFRCLYVPEAIVLHKCTDSIVYDSPNSVYYSHRNLEWVYIKNMPAALILKSIWLHVIYNMAALFFFSINGRLKPFILSKRDAFKGLRKMLKKRRRIQSGKKVDDRYLWNLMDNEFYFPRLTRRLRRRDRESKTEGIG